MLAKPQCSFGYEATVAVLAEEKLERKRGSFRRIVSPFIEQIIELRLPPGIVSRDFGFEFEDLCCFMSAAVAGDIKGEAGNRESFIAELCAIAPERVKLLLRDPACGGQCVERIGAEIRNHIKMLRERGKQPLTAAVEAAIVDLVACITRLAEAADDISGHEYAAGIVRPPAPAAVVMLVVVKALKAGTDHLVKR